MPLGVTSWHAANGVPNGRPTPTIARTDAADGSALVAGIRDGAGSPPRAYSARVTAAGQVEMVSIEPADGTTFYTYGQAINGSRTVVGETSTSTFGRPFIAPFGAALRVLPEPANEPSVNIRIAYGINDRGVVVGEWENKPLLFDGTTSRILAMPADANGNRYPASALDINDDGTAVGVAYTPVGVRPQAAAWTVGALNDGLRWLPLLPNPEWSPTSRAWAVNHAGDAVGASYTAMVAGERTVLHAALWPGSASVVRDLGSLKGAGAAAFQGESEALAINDHGTVVGSSTCAASAALCGFVWTEQGGMRDLNALIDPAAGWRIHKATGVSNAGFIVAQAYAGGQTIYEDVILVPATLPAATTALALRLRP